MANNQIDKQKTNSTAFRIIAVLAFIALHAAAYFLSSAPMGILHAHPALWALPVAAFAALVVCVAMVNTDFFEDNKIGYIILIALSFASAVCVGYNPGA